MNAGVYRCPQCGGGLATTPVALECSRCSAPWPTIDGLPTFVVEDRIGRLDRIMRRIYDTFGRGHDPALRLLLPMVDGLTESQSRQRLLDRLPLDELRGAARAIRVLDVSFGTGGELLGLAAELPGAELFGLDLSRTMARIGATRLREAGVAASLCLGDAHYLPYADDSFDLVVHVGGINAFADKRRALAEMLRVARPGAPIAVVDERLDPSRPHHLWKRALFGLVTWWDRVQQAPVEELPAAAEAVSVEQLLTFYYLLTFRKPA